MATALRERLRAEEQSLARAEPLDLFADRVEVAFRAYHAERPWVLQRLVAMARRYRGAGRACGIGFLFEVLRHEEFMASRDAEGFKLNNNFRSRYVRLIEDTHADLRGYFHKRRLRAQGDR